MGMLPLEHLRVVILDPPTKGHVIQRMRNPKIA